MASTDEEEPIGIDILANDGDVPTAGTLTITDNPANGTVVIDDRGNSDPSDDSVTYIPNTDFVGIDSFVYEICDNATPANCSQATVVINVDQVVDAVNDVVTVSENDSVTIDVLANDMNVPDATVQFGNTIDMVQAMAQLKFRIRMARQTIRATM